jgi:hypothetical protein
LSTVATTTRNMQLPNQEAQQRDLVSGSPAIPFLIHLDGTDEAEHRADGIHEIGTGVEVTADTHVGFVDTCVAVLGIRIAGKTSAYTTESRPSKALPLS